MKITITLLLIIGICFVAQLLIPGLTEKFYFVPSLMFKEPWRIITSMFLHDTSGIEHIFFNSFSLFLFGSILERKVTNTEYLMIYFGAGIVGGLFYYLTYVAGWIDAPALGASGAIFGILGAVAVLLPSLVVYVFFVPMPVRVAAVVWFVLEFFGIFNTAASGVASAAHVGGLITGIVIAYLISKRNIVETTTWNYEEHSEPPVMIQ